MSPIVFEINEDKIYKDKCCGEFYVMFFLLMLKKKCRASKHFAGPVDARCCCTFESSYLVNKDTIQYWSYRASIILS